MRFIIKIILLPFAIVYGLIMELRNLLYATGALPVHRFDVPVISVGNLTAGGTGKTPFVIYLIRILSGRFRNMVVVSRGYGRQSKGLAVVSDGRRILLHPQQGGDEPVLIARKSPRVPVVAAERRHEGIRYALEQFNADCILLDDAFQHRSVWRDVDIVLWNAGERWRCNWPLPAGRLREFKHNLKRAHLLVFTNAGPEKSLPQIPPDIPRTEAESRLHHLVDVDFNQAGALSDLRDKKTAAFAGIAHPQNFRNSLETEGIEPQIFFSFKDHYNYTFNDLTKMAAACKRQEIDTLVCTEKDLVKIAAIAGIKEFIQTENIRFLGAAMDLRVRNEKLFEKQILDLLKNK